jgi:hypothetical protein
VARRRLDVRRRLHLQLDENGNAGGGDAKASVGGDLEVLAGVDTLLSGRCFDWLYARESPALADKELNCGAEGGVVETRDSSDRQGSGADCRLGLVWLALLSPWPATSRAQPGVWLAYRDGPRTTFMA